MDKTEQQLKDELLYKLIQKEIDEDVEKGLLKKRYDKENNTFIYSIVNTDKTKTDIIKIKKVKRNKND